MNQKTNFTVGLIIMLLGMFISTVAVAAPFRMVGPRGQGMGGAGVASIDDENAGVWNPAMVGQHEGFVAGVQAGLQAQFTNDFLFEAEDLQDFEKDYDSFDNIVDSRFSDTGAYANFISLIKELRDVNKEGQGLLIDAGGGLNFGRGNWSITANNYTSFAGNTDFLLDNIVFEGMTGEGGDTIAREFVTGDSTITTVSGASSDSHTYDATTITTIKNELDEALGSDTLALFGLDGTSEEAAHYIAYRLQEAGYSDTVTDEVLREASQTLMPSLVSIARGDTDTFDTKAQNLVLQGAMVNEIAFNYSYPEPILVILESPLYIGGSVKYLQGEIGYLQYNVFDDNDIDEEAEDTLDNKTEKSSDFGVDVGFVWDARKKMGLKLGLSGKYLNEPEFDYPVLDEYENIPEKLTIEPQWRAGLSGYPLEWIYKIPGMSGGKNWFGHDWWRIAVDYDLTTNETILPGYEAQYLAIGNEFNIFNRPWINLALRAGMRTNTAQDLEGDLYTVGLGINLVRVNIDLSGTISDKDTKDDDGDDIPSLAGAAVNVSMRF